MTQTSSTSKTKFNSKKCDGKHIEPEINCITKLSCLICFVAYLQNTTSWKYPLTPNPSFPSRLYTSSFNCQDIKQPTKSHKKRQLLSNIALHTNRERNKRPNKATSKLKISSTKYEKEQTISKTVFSPPEPINSLKIASFSENNLQSDENIVEDLNVINFVRVDTFNNTTPIQIKRISHAPHMFHIKNFMSKTEREIFLSSRLHDSNANVSFEVAGTVSSKNEINVTSSPVRPHSKVAWISPIYSSSSKSCIPEKDDLKATLASITNSLTSACASIFLSPSLFQEISNKKKQSRPRFTFLGSEDLQLVQYKRNGEFKLHHDGVPRLLTIIFYVNGVAGTWFPLADVNKKQNVDEIPLNKGRALELMKGYRPGTNGVLLSTGSSDHSSKASKENEESNQHVIDGMLQNVNDHSIQEHSVVPIEAGDAVAFYNYIDVPAIENSMDGNRIQVEHLCEDMYGRIDWRALHAGLPTEADEKWIATLWYLIKEEL